MSTDTKMMRKKMNKVLDEVANEVNDRVVYVATENGFKTINYADFKAESRKKIVKNESARLSKLTKSDIANLTALVGVGQKEFDRELV